MLVVAVVGGAAALLVVTARNVVHSALYLVIALLAVAGTFLLLGAEFLAWAQVLVYVGAVVVLLLFAVMLTRAPIGASADLDRPAWPAVLVGGGVGLGLAVLLADAFRWTLHPLPQNGNAERMGAQIFGNWVLPFEVVSILLLSALIGAIVLSRPDIGKRAE